MLAAVAAAALIAVGVPQPRAAAEEPAGPGDEAFLRWLPDDCRAFGWMDVPAVLRSEAALRAKPSEWTALGRWRESVAPVGLELGQVEWIAFGSSGLVPMDKARTVVVYRPKSPLAGAASAGRAPVRGWQEEKVGQRVLHVKSGPPGMAKPWAVCQADERTVLAGDVDAVRAVLRRSGPAKLPEKLDRARQRLDRSKPLAAAFVFPDKTDVPEIESLMICRELLPRVEAVRIEAEFKAEVELRVAVDCRDEATAHEVKGVGITLWTVVQALSKSVPNGDGQKPIESARFSVADRVLGLDVKLPVGPIVSWMDFAGLSSGPVNSFQEPVTCYPSTETGPCLAPAPAAYLPPSAETCPPAPGAGYGPPPLTPVVPYEVVPYAPVTAPATVAPCLGPPVVARAVPSPAYATLVAATPGAIAPPPAVWDPYTPTPSYPPPMCVHVPPAVTTFAYPAPAGSPPLLDVAEVARLLEAKVDERAICVFVMKRRVKSPITADDLILLSSKGASGDLLCAVQAVPVAPPVEVKADAPKRQPSDPPPHGHLDRRASPSAGDGAFLPQFRGLEGKLTAVVCRPNAALLVRNPTAAKDLARQIGMLLEARAPATKVVDPGKVDEWMEKNGGDDYATIGKALGADMVLGVELDEFSLIASQTLYQGTAKLALKVIDCKQDTIAVFEKRAFEVTHPPNRVIPASESKESKFREEFIDVLARRVARPFVSVELSNDN